MAAMQGDSATTLEAVGRCVYGSEGVHSACEKAHR